MTGFSGEIHPYAAGFRLLVGDELADLAAGIADGIADDPIILDQNGVLIDGRNRLAACELAGVDPAFEVRELTEHEAVELIRRRNNRRRHDSPGAQAMNDAVGLQLLGKRRNGRWVRGTVMQDSALPDDEQRARQVAMSRAGFVLDWRPDLADQVRSETMALDAAYQAAKAAEDEAKAEQRAAELAASLLSDLRDNRPDLADLVDSGSLPLDDALTVRDKERAEETKRINGIRERRRKFSEDLSGAIHYLAPLARFTERTEQVTTDLDPSLMLRPVTADDIEAARKALDLVQEALT